MQPETIETMHGAGTPSTPPASLPRRAAAVLFLLLLAGLLIFNRTFASVGRPPVYISEVVLAFALAVALFDFKTAFIEPLKRSHAMQLVAAFMLHGIVRICVDAQSHGLDAARDGVICLYAVAAFLGPWLVESLSRKPAPTRTDLSSGSTGVQIFHRFLTVASVPALLWANAVYANWIDAPAGVKVDFLTLSAAVAYTISTANIYYWLMRHIAFPDKLSATRAGSHSKVALGAVLSLAVWAVAGTLIFCLPTRALLPAFFIMPVALAIVGCKRRLTWKSSLMVLCIVVAISVGAAGVYLRSRTAREKLEAIADPNDSHFQTLEGQRAAHSVKWRLVFWRRCIAQTAEHAPFFGLGFGSNLTDLLRDTPEWPMFEDSQNAAKYGSPNRHPHSAHITIFARLGGAGILLWVSLLAMVGLRGWKNMYSHSEAFWIHLSPASQSFASLADFLCETALVSLWLIYLLAMSFGVVLENPFGGIWFWTLTGMIANRRL